MHDETVIKCLSDLFALRGVPSYIHSDYASYFTSRGIKNYLTSRGVVSSHSFNYHPPGYSRVERYIGVIWRSVKLAFKSRKLA